MNALPRLVIAGLAGDSGKTLVSVGLALALRDRGMRVAGFKKGPDYIDAAWLTWATGTRARNLDTWMMGAEVARQAFATHATAEGVNLIEGNRGLYDGSDARGTHSTAELAKLLGAPVVLVVDAAKATRTVAALVLGCQTLDRDVPLAGVILNRVGGSRHERVLRESIEAACRLPVFGVVPRAEGQSLLPARHLGLVTPQEHADMEAFGRGVRDLVKDLDVDALVALARAAAALPSNPAEAGFHKHNVGSGFSRICRVGVLADSAFTFYYPENLEALQSAGATLNRISALTAKELPRNLDALYIGGGFPETHAAALSSNVPFLRSLREAAEMGLPIYAECGGLMLLASAICSEGRAFPMAGVLPVEVEMRPKPQGHGYTELVVDAANPFFAGGTTLRGHEFHYSRLIPGTNPLATACSVLRGTGCLPGRDGLLVHRTFASYTHLHALATPEWAPGVVSAARRFAESR